jgi:hypothetical protein
LFQRPASRSCWPAGRGQGVEVQPGACGAVRANTAVVEDDEKLEAMGVSDAPGCRQDPAFGGPGAAVNAKSAVPRRRPPGRGDQRRPRQRRRSRRDQGGWAARGSCCCTMLILARSSQCRARQAGRVGARLSIDQRRDRRSQRSKPATRTHRVRIASGKRRITATASTGSRTTYCRT